MRKDGGKLVRLFYASKRFSRLAVFICGLSAVIVLNLTFLTAFHHHEDSHTACHICTQLHQLEKNLSAETIQAGGITALLASTLMIIYILTIFFAAPTPVSLKTRMDN